MNVGLKLLEPSPSLIDLVENVQTQGKGTILLKAQNGTVSETSSRFALFSFNVWAAHGLRILPGLLLTLLIAAIAFGLRLVPVLAIISPIMLAMLIGIAYRFFARQPAWAVSGVLFSQRRLLRIAIVLLGLQLTVTQIIELGAIALIILTTTLIFTFIFTVQVGRFLDVDPKLAQLIASGTAICGASAVFAANEVVKGTEEDVTYAVACVTVFGTIAMLLYPLLPALLNLGPAEFGLWTGSSIHEIAQVVAASFQNGQIAGEFATIAKLSRVIMLAPLVIALDLLTRRAQNNGQASDKSARRPFIPWFVVGFIVAVSVSSIVTIPVELKSHLMLMTTLLLAMALAAMGLQTDLANLRRKGFRPALLGALAFAFIGSFSLVCIKLLG